MALHAASGWWGEAASAPQGMGWMTNQLAAFPSMHAGWALWVALAISAATANRALRAAGWAHAVITAVVVVGTGNHWLLDVVAGWAVVVSGVAASPRRAATGVAAAQPSGERATARCGPAHRRSSSTSAAARP